MEEKKLNMKTTENPKKLSYDDLKNAANQISVQANALAQENNRLKQQIQNMNLSNLFTELDFRFKVLEHAEHFNQEFVTKIVESIEQAMTPVEETNEDAGQ